MKLKNKGLGKGLDALINPDFYEQTSNTSDLTSISINKIEPNKNQPRSRFDDHKIEELSSSIKAQGVLQPILVRKDIQGRFQIIAGERRWRASIKAGLKTIPAIVRDYSDAEALAIALIENLQREDLNIIEQANALHKLKNELNINQEELSEYIGKSRSHLANTLRLLNLPQEIQNIIQDNKISAGHARALLSMNDQKMMIFMANEIVDKQLSVRETEKRIYSLINKRKKTVANKTDINLADNMKSLLREKINKDLKVKFKGTPEKSQVTITFTNNNQLQEFINLLGK